MMRRLRDTTGMVRARGWIHRHVVGLASVAAVLTLAAFVLGAAGLALARDEAAHRARVEHAQALQGRAKQRQDAWDRQAADAAACERQENGRVQSRASFFDVLDLIAAGSPTSSPRHAAVLVFVVDAKAKVLHRLPDIDCAMVAPQPRGPRPRVPT